MIYVGDKDTGDIHGTGDETDSENQRYVTNHSMDWNILIQITKDECMRLCHMLEQSMDWIITKAGLDVKQGHPLCRTQFLNTLLS